MSCFIVSENEVKLVAIYAATDYNGKVDLKKATDVANTLYRANYRGVNYRYNDKNHAPKLRVSDFDVRGLSHHGAAQIAMSIRCINYQSCDPSNWEKSKACKILRELGFNLLAKLAELSNQPHKWGLS